MRLRLRRAARGGPDGADGQPLAAGGEIGQPLTAASPAGATPTAFDHRRAVAPAGRLPESADARSACVHVRASLFAPGHRARGRSPPASPSSGAWRVA